MMNSAGASRRWKKVAKAVALGCLLFGTRIGAADAACVCSTVCTECVSCVPEYVTPDFCDACYRSTSVGNAIRCSFTGVLATPRLAPGGFNNRVLDPIFRVLPGTRRELRIPGPGAGILPGTRPQTIRPRMLAGVLPGTRPQKSRSRMIAGILPGTRPQTIRPRMIAGILPGTRPETIRPRVIARVLPGTRPDAIHPSIFAATPPDTGAALVPSSALGLAIAPVERVDVLWVAPPGARPDSVPPQIAGILPGTHAPQAPQLRRSKRHVAGILPGTRASKAKRKQDKEKRARKGK